MNNVESVKSNLKLMSPLARHTIMRYINFLLLTGSLCIRMNGKQIYIYIYIVITNENQSTISNGLLEKHCSIYTAEAFAIKLAAEYCFNIHNWPLQPFSQDY